MMQTVILCGGKGTRMREETEHRPKPLVEVGGKPIIWHIMKLYAHHGYNDFIFTLGYKGRMIKEHFMYYKAFANDFTLNMETRDIRFHKEANEDFRITFAETGLESTTGERVLAVRPYITEDEFMVTYGDGVGDIDIKKLVAFHRAQGTIGTITGVHPNSKWGLLKEDPKTHLVTDFYQKPLLSDYVNGGFMVFNKKIFDYLDNGHIESAFSKLAHEKQLSVFHHEGFWKAMDTYNEMQEMNEIWEKQKPWAVWES